MKWIAGYIAAICVLILIIAQSLFIATFYTMPYKRWHFDQHSVAENIGISYDELIFVTEELLGYMRGRRDDLYIYLEVSGEYRQFFSDRDIRHMVDVRDLYDAGFLIRNITFWLLLLLILAMAFFRVPILEVMARCCREVFVCFLILVAILTGVIAFDWNRAFVVFHEIFFDNNYWMLTPGVDPLIDMVNHPFFLYMSIIIGVIFGLSSAVIIVVSTLYLRMIRPWNDTRTMVRFR